MVMFNVYDQTVIRTYRTHVCSFATIFFISVGVIVFLSPLLIGYHSLGFWLRESTYREQPEVHFKHQYILLTHGSSADGATGGSYLGYSSFQNFNAFLGYIDDPERSPIVSRISTLKSREIDENFDGRFDYLDYEIEIPLMSKESVTAVQLFLFFDYKLHKYCSLRMQSLAYIHYQSSFSGSAFYTDGELKLKQKYPLPHKGSFTVFNIPIVDQESTDTGKWDLQNILSTYQARNVSTDFIGRYPVWKAGVPNQPFFIMKGKVYYPEETVLYRPGLWQVIKHAWIQYVAILFIFSYVFGHVKKFVYENRLVNVVVRKDHKD